tara:strand:- start:32 stop:676 length:645 start_codon:yes stop_codon:yes gene_type:complete
MAGTLSVQKIQGLASSATPTTVEIASGHTLVQSGAVMQTVTNVDNSGITMSGAQTVKFLDFPFTTKAANSIIDVKFNCQIYVVNNTTGNVDSDIALAAGFKTGSATSSSTDYTAITTYAPTRQNITFAGSVTRAFYASDAYEVSSSHAYRYNPLNAVNYQESFSPSLAAGTTIRVAIFVSQNYQQSINYKIGAGYAGSSDMGATSCLNITEIAQ